MNTMIYKGYAARIEYSEEDGCFVGHLAGIRDIVGFDGTTVDELKQRFHEAVDDYLWGCEQLGTEPNKPFRAGCCFVFRRSCMRAPAWRHRSRA